MFIVKWEKLQANWTPQRDKLGFINDETDLLSRVLWAENYYYILLIIRSEKLSLFHTYLYSSKMVVVSCFLTAFTVFSIKNLTRDFSIMQAFPQQQLRAFKKLYTQFKALVSSTFVNLYSVIIQLHIIEFIVGFIFCLL